MSKHPWHPLSLFLSFSYTQVLMVQNKPYQGWTGIFTLRFLYKHVVDGFMLTRVLHVLTRIRSLNVFSPFPSPTLGSYIISSRKFQLCKITYITRTSVYLGESNRFFWHYFEVPICENKNTVLSLRFILGIVL